MITSHFFKDYILVLYLLLLPVLTIFLKAQLLLQCIFCMVGIWLLSGISVCRTESGLRVFLESWRLSTEGIQGIGVH